MKIRQDPRWPTAHKSLKKLFDERAGMSQAEFGATYGLGTQGMVWQYLSGYTPLNVEAAAKFAKGLGCTISDISPEMAAALQNDVLPVLGARILRSALKAVVSLLLSVPPLLPQKAEAATLHNVVCRIVGEERSPLFIRKAEG